MRLVLNVIWLVFGGLWLALGYLLAALICFLLIVTIPFGFASLRIAAYALWPFGRTIVDKPGDRPGALIGNIVWVLTTSALLIALPLGLALEDEAKLVAQEKEMFEQQQGTQGVSYRVFARVSDTDNIPPDDADHVPASRATKGHRASRILSGNHSSSADLIVNRLWWT